MNIYQEKLIDNYENPRNYGVIEDPSARARLENLSCGDSIEVFLKIQDEKIEDIKFSGEGCSVAVASMSVLSEFVKNKTIDDILKINLEKIVELLGVELTLSRLKCAGLGLETLKKAIGDYLERS